jgi:hypothetical protein
MLRYMHIAYFVNYICVDTHGSISYTCPLLMQWALEHRNAIILVNSLERMYREVVVILGRRHIERIGMADPSTAAAQVTAADVGFLCRNTAVMSADRAKSCYSELKGRRGENSVLWARRLN